MQELKFGIMLNDFVLKKWQLLAIQNLQHSGLICAFLILPEPEIETKSVYKKNIKSRLFYRIFQRFFLKVPLLENIDASEFLQDIKKIYVRPIKESNYSFKFENADLEAISDYKPDFILRFGFNIIRGDILKVAKFGVWSFHHDDDEVIRGGPPGFWEIFLNKDINGIVLQRLTDELDKGFIVKKAMIPVISHSYSTHLNELLQQGLYLLDFAIENLNTYGNIQFQNPSTQKGRLYKFPSNKEMLHFIFIILKNKFNFHFKDLFFHENWNVAVSNQSVNDFFIQQKVVVKKWIPKNSNRYFAADPFIVDLSDNKSVILYEEFDYKHFKGNISKLDIYENGEFSKDEILLSSANHLSFPYCKKENNSFEVFPENCASGKLVKFQFDNHLKPLNRITVFEKDAVDAILFEYNKIEWIFCGLKSYNPNNYLFLFYKDETGKYVSHPKNPVVANASFARMAGQIIQFEKEYYRPSQKNNKVYGEKIVISKILVLDKENYLEQFVFEIDTPEKSKFNRGIHTINFGDKYMVFDAKMDFFSWHQFVRNLKRKLRVS